MECGNAARANIMIPDKNMKTSKRIADGFCNFLAACPYTLVGKKLFSNNSDLLTGSPQPAAHEAQRIIHKIRLGRNIALIGVFCPFFWISLLSGAPRNIVKFNAAHSGLVVLAGGLIMAIGRYQLNRLKR